MHTPQRSAGGLNGRGRADNRGCRARAGVGLVRRSGRSSCARTARRMGDRRGFRPSVGRLDPRPDSAFRAAWVVRLPPCRRPIGVWSLSARPHGTARRDIRRRFEPMTPARRVDTAPAASESRAAPHRRSGAPAPALPRGSPDSCRPRCGSQLGFLCVCYAPVRPSTSPVIPRISSQSEAELSPGSPTSAGWPSTTSA
jgi:hypothetical protein